MIDFIIEHDANRIPSGIVAQSDVIYNLVLAANTEKIVSVPAGSDVVLFGTTGNFFCKMNATVEVPAGDIVDGSAGELNPSSRQVNGVSTIHLISSSNIIVTLAFYNVPRPSFTHIPTGF